MSERRGVSLERGLEERRRRKLEEERRREKEVVRARERESRRREERRLRGREQTCSPQEKTLRGRQDLQAAQASREGSYLSFTGIEGGWGSRQLEQVTPCLKTFNFPILQVAKSHHIPRAEVRPWVSLMALARDEEEEREGGGRGEPRGNRHHQHNHTDGMGPVGEIWLEFDGYRETSLKMFPVEHQHGRSEKGERDILSREKVVMPSQEEFGRERSSSSLQREEEEIEGRSGFFRLLGKQQEQQEEELSPAFMEYLGRSKSRGYLRHSSDLAQGYLRGSSEVAQGYSRSSSEEKGKHDSLTPAFHHYLGSVIHRHSNSSTGSEDSRSILGLHTTKIVATSSL